MPMRGSVSPCNQMFDEREAPDGNERFRLAHAAGFAGCEYRGGKHVGSFVLQACDVREFYRLVMKICSVAAHGD